MTNFVSTFKTKESRTKLQSLIPNMLQVIARMLNEEDEECAQAAIKQFTSLAGMSTYYCFIVITSPNF